MSTATVRVLLFASLRESVGASEIEVPIGASARVADVLATLQREHRGLTDGSFTVALNQTYVQSDAEVAPGDELALIPPVSGG